MNRVIISGIGVEIPEHRVTNAELVESYNTWVDVENARREGSDQPLVQKSTVEFIEHASGIKARHMIDKAGVLDPKRMAPFVPERADEELSVEAEFGLKAARRAIEHAGCQPEDIDLVICSSSHHQRPYPAIAIEIQEQLGARGAGFDMGLGCSSAAAALHVAAKLVRSGGHKRILLVVPEIVTSPLDFRDRQTHFILGDAAVAMVIEPRDEEKRPGRFEVIDTRMWTQMSSNIRNNLGFLTRSAQPDPYLVPMQGNLIKQVGNKVFKEVTVAGHKFIVDFLGQHDLTPNEVRRFWLHQANARMNNMILKLAFGQEVGHDRAPMVLDRLGNTAAAGAIIAMQENHEDMKPGEYGLLCAFGAGYSIGGALLRMM